jgi:hypothetical protein
MINIIDYEDRFRVIKLVDKAVQYFGTYDTRQEACDVLDKVEQFIEQGLSTDEIHRELNLYPHHKTVDRA